MVQHLLDAIDSHSHHSPVNWVSHWRICNMPLVNNSARTTKILYMGVSFCLLFLRSNNGESAFFQYVHSQAKHCGTDTLFSDGDGTECGTSSLYDSSSRGLAGKICFLASYCQFHCYCFHMHCWSMPFPRMSSPFEFIVR